METIVQKHKKNFENLRRAFLNDDVALVDCIEKSTNEHVAVICAVVPENDTTHIITHIIPFARFFNGNPYDMLISPIDEEYTTE